MFGPALLGKASQTWIGGGLYLVLKPVACLSLCSCTAAAGALQQANPKNPQDDPRCTPVTDIKSALHLNQVSLRTSNCSASKVASCVCTGANRKLLHSCLCSILADEHPLTERLHPPTGPEQLHMGGHQRLRAVRLPHRHPNLSLLLLAQEDGAHLSDSTVEEIRVGQMADL